MACTLRGKKVFSVEFFMAIKLDQKGVNVGTFKFVATISRKPKCRKILGIESPNFEAK